MCIRDRGYICNIASVLCLEKLIENPEQYKKVFNDSKINIVIECAHPNSWYRHTKHVIGIETYGESGNGNDLLEHFGFTPEKIAEKIKKML